MNNELVLFLIPNLDRMQIIFFVLIVGLSLLSILSVHKNAISTSWENNWNNSNEENSSNYLDVEHGSVDDIYNAVATKSEKMAESMPGILLIIGLLGTFIGLGVALNHAATLLQNSSGLTSDTMDNLMPMMQGLGTKFKTSTWGIMAFLALKFWMSLNAFDERRLNWCIKKIRKELDVKRQSKAVQQQEKHNEFISTLMEMQNRFCTTLQEEMTANRQAIKEGNSLQASNFGAVQKSNQLLTYSAKAIQKSNDLLESNIEFVQKGNELLVSNRETIQESNHLIELNRELTQKMNVLLATHTEVAQKGNELFSENIETIQEGNKLLTTIHENGQVRNALLVDTRQLLTDSNTEISTITNQFKNQLEISQELEIQASATRIAIDKFVDSNVSNIEKMQDSTLKMADAANRVGESAHDLKSAIAGFTDGVSDVLDSLKNDLSETINGMNESFTKNMGEMSGTLNIATKGISDATSEISDAVKDLSVSVGQTMSSVETTIRESLEIQTKAQEQAAKLQEIAQREFITTSTTLNENVEAMTGLINKLQKDILSGLQAVSNSNLQVKTLNTKYANVTDSLEQTSKTLEEATVLISTLVEGNQVSSQEMRAVIDSFREFYTDFNDKTTEAINVINQFMIKKISSHEPQLNTSQGLIDEVNESADDSKSYLSSHSSENVE